MRKTAYHVDREGALKPGTRIEPVYRGNIHKIQGLSHWGLMVVEPIVSSDMINTLNLEAHAEAIRKELFPELLSRLQVLFAFESLDDMRLWAPILKLDERMPIYKIYYEGKSYKLDARHLNQNAVFSIGAECNDLSKAICGALVTRDGLRQYWSGEFTEDPLPELLIELPVIIGERVELNDS